VTVELLSQSHCDNVDLDHTFYLNWEWMFDTIFGHRHRRPGSSNHARTAKGRIAGNAKLGIMDWTQLAGNVARRFLEDVEEIKARKREEAEILTHRASSPRIGGYTGVQRWSWHGFGLWTMVWDGKVRKGLSNVELYR
jgi:hypothetical protein